MAKGRWDGEGMAQGMAQGWRRDKRNGGGLAQDKEMIAKGGVGMVKGGGGGMAQAQRRVLWGDPVAWSACHQQYTHINYHMHLYP